MSAQRILDVIGDHWPEIGSWVDDSSWLMCSCGWDSSKPKAVDWVTHLEDAIKESDMDQVIVTIDGKDHKIGYGEHTMCMLPVPHGTTREDGAKPCTVCFPKDEQAPEPEAPFSIATPAEDLGHYENPDAAEGEAGYVEPTGDEAEKPAKKATKAK